MREKKKDRMLLQKPSGSIAVADNTTALQRKFYNILLYNARRELENNRDITLFSVKLSEIKSFYGILSKKNTYIKDLLLNLTKIVVEFNILEKDKDVVWGAFSLLPYVSLKKDKETGEVIVEYEIPSPVRKSIISKHGIYGKIDLLIIKKLNSKYAIILYELMKDYENVEMPKMSIDTFKKLFGIENKYSKFYNIKERVLKPAIDEINSNLNIPWKIEVELIKTGNRYTHIKFHKINKEDIPLLESNINKLLDMVPHKYRDGVLKILEIVLLEYSFEYIKAQIEYVNNQSGVINYCAYLKKSIKDNYAQYDIEKSSTSKEHIKETKETDTQDNFYEKAKKIWLTLSEEEKQRRLNSVNTFSDSPSIKQHKAILDLSIELKNSHQN